MYKVFKVRENSFTHTNCLALIQDPTFAHVVEQLLNIVDFCLDLELATKEDALYLVIIGRGDRLDSYSNPDLIEVDPAEINGAAFYPSIGTGALVAYLGGVYNIDH